MCYVIDNYAGCALFGHPLESTTSLLEHQLCDEARAAGRFGDCKGASMKSAADFKFPFCLECDKVDAQLHEKVKLTLASNMQAGACETLVLTEEFVKQLQSLPIDAARAPDVSYEEISGFLREYSVTKAMETDTVRAALWVRAESRRSSPRVGTMEGMAEQFARWFVAAYKLRNIESAMAIAEGEKDESRIQLLHFLENQAQVGLTYRARLEYLGVFGLFLSFSGIGDTIPNVLATEGVADEKTKDNLEAAPESCLNGKRR